MHKLPTYDQGVVTETVTCEKCRTKFNVCQHALNLISEGLSDEACDIPVGHCMCVAKVRSLEVTGDEWVEIRVRASTEDMAKKVFNKFLNSFVATKECSLDDFRVISDGGYHED